MSRGLPQSWIQVPLGTVGDWGSGGTPSRADSKAYGGSIPWIKIGDLPDGPVLAVEETITEHGLNVSSAKLLEAQSLLVAMYGSIGKLGITTMPCATNQAIAYCKPANGFDLRYLFYLLMCERHRLLDEGQGGTQSNISQTILKAHKVPIAPTAEQKRIASKLDELFSRIEEGERALGRVQALVERYRQSVLKAAVTGELTRSWREQRKGKLESGETLLQRILKARRAAWEMAELDKMKAKGIAPSNDKWMQKYSEPIQPDADQLPALPHGWVWGTIDQLCVLENGDRGSNYPSRAHYVDAGVPFITAGNIQGWKIDLGGLNFITEERFALLRAGQIEPGDLLFCLRGSLGKVALNPLERGAIASSLVILRPVSPVVTKYLLLYFKSPLAAREIEKYDNGTAQPNLAGADLARFVIPVPPASELSLICDQAEKAVAAAEWQIESLRDIGSRAEALRQAILFTAFTGKLVKEESSDEPASVLLERIAAERSAATTARSRRDRDKKKEKTA